MKLLGRYYPAYKRNRGSDEKGGTHPMHTIIGLLAIGMILLPLAYEILFDDYGDHFAAAILMIEIGTLIVIVNFA